MIGGKALIIVGGTGMGKTTFIKSCLSKVNKSSIYLFDVNAEYAEFSDIPLPKFSVFCNKALDLQQAVIVFEEATIFLNNRGSNETLIEILVRKRHTQNLVFLVFHSLRSVPKYLIDLCNIMVLHKTNDPLSIAEVFGNQAITDAFVEIKNGDMLQNEQGKTFSPHRVIKLIS